jgi:hypothetical protein
MLLRETRKRRKAQKREQQALLGERHLLPRKE